MKISVGTGILDKIVNIAIITVSILLLIYTGYRAATLSFTIDESISFNVFVPLKFMDIVSYKIASSNHHMINTLCMKFMSMIFGSSEFSLRFPSLLSHLFYIIFTYKIVKKISSPNLVLAGFLLLNLNPYMLDFFSLARGYSLAVTFSVGSIFFLLSYIDDNKDKYIIWSLIFAMLATLSNFPLLIYYLSLISIINLYWIGSLNIFKLKEVLKKNIPVFICSILLIIIMFEPIRKLVKYKEFYDGGLNGFWADTVGSLISATLYEQPYQQIASVFLKYFIGVSSLAMIITLTYNFYIRKWRILTEGLTLAIILLFLPCIVTIAQHIILKSNYLINRMALFLIPIFFFSILLLISNFTKSLKWKILTMIFIYVVAGAFTFHTIKSLNTSCALYWRFDADTKKMLSDLDIQVKKVNLCSVKLGVMSLYEPAINFYRKTKKYAWLEKVTKDGYRDMNYNYYYLGDSSMNYINSRNLSVIKHYSISNSCLVR